MSEFALAKRHVLSRLIGEGDGNLSRKEKQQLRKRRGDPARMGAGQVGWAKYAIGSVSRFSMVDLW